MTHHAIKRSLCVLIAIAFFTNTLFSFQEQFTTDDAPDELSLVHSESPGLKNCLKCHTDELEVPAKKCLACHTEIAQRITQSRGYHQDKNEDCAVCHSEHQGKEGKIVDLDPEDFDHEETGYAFKGAHTKVKNCRNCHRKENTFPRKKSLSYLMKDTGCLTCHQSPHPGNQDVCLSCHSQDNWYVDIWDQRESP
ncbi:hypothetical protein ACFLT2_10015 [Acidobacteriota bacterium]